MIGNTAPDAIKYMRDTAVLAATDAAGRVYVSQAPQSASYPLVVMEIVSREESPTQDEGSAVDTYRVQVDVYSKKSRDGADPSAFEQANTIAYNLRAVWSRSQSGVGDYDNSIDSIQEAGYRSDFIPDLDVYMVSNDYMVRVVGDGTSIVAGQVVVKANVMFRSKVTLDYTDFATAATTNTIDLGFTLPAKGILHLITGQPNIYFSGGAISAYTLKVGKTGDLDRYIMDQSVFTGATLPEVVMAGGNIESMTTATAFKVTATSTGANLSEATAGEIEFWIYYSILN